MQKYGTHGKLSHDKYVKISLRNKFPNERNKLFVLGLIGWFAVSVMYYIP